MFWYKLILSAVFILIAGCNRENPSDEAEIKNNAKAYEAAYNNKDASTVASFWAENAVYVDSDSGKSITGRKSIGEYFKNIFDDESPKIDITIDRVILSGSDKAIEQGHVKFTYHDGTMDETAYQAENIKENGKWRLQKLREIEVGNATINYSHLEDLNWLVGNWKNTDENTDINLQFKWSKNNNYLFEHFTVNILDQEEMEGIQIIAWDPSQDRIRSWVFDSDGGIREGIWIKEGDNLIATMVSILPDGKKASSVDVYTKVNEQHFDFAMNSRDVNGEVLPDIGPVKFTKIK